ncbi:MAG: penicillin-binding protein 1A [Desulfobacterales bacterium]|nr:penicillin-binding protein 1A [Desulfobacterales bacterium]
MAESNQNKKIVKKRARKSPGSWRRRLVRWFAGITLLVLVAGGLTAAGFFLHISRQLPKITSLADYRPSTVSVVYADDGEKIAEFYEERRIVLPLEAMPDMLVEAFLAAEDSRFYEHRGIDFVSIVRAFFKNIEAGEIVQGGSTITQQVTKSFFLTPERSYKRKLKEAILAYRITKTFSKQDVLYLYLNQIYLGHGAYGVEAAAENYFDKSVEDLNLAECAILAGLPQAPSRYSPYRHPERARKRQHYVLNRMQEEGFITAEQAEEARSAPWDIKPRRNWFAEKAPFYTEHVRRYIEQKYGADAINREGLKIFTAVNLAMQHAAREEIVKGLHELDKRQGYRGPLTNIPEVDREDYLKTLTVDQADRLETGVELKGLVTAVDNRALVVKADLGAAEGLLALEDMDWARKPDPDVVYWAAKVKRPGNVLRVGDVIQVRLKAAPEQPGEPWPLSLEQTPVAQSALLCFEAETGFVKAMIGGRSFEESQFNRAFQSRRQPGSAFKPLIYAAAIDKGYTPASIILDSPIVFEDTERDFTWKPRNYKEKFYGPTRLREALAKSRNVVTVKLLKDIGIDYAIDYSRKLGIHSHLNRDLSIALGSSGVSLLEIVNAYSVFVNNGYRVKPIFVTRIEDRDGNVLEEARSEKEKVIENTTAFIMNSMLESVVKEGTGQRVKALNRPVAGKTGTTNNLYDAWFVGYTPDYITGVWVGMDEEASMGRGETGSRAASPIWLAFMQKAIAAKPVKAFEVPDGIVFSRIDAETGLLPIPESTDTIFECFKEGTEPTEYTKPPDTIADPEDFFKAGM